MQSRPQRRWFGLAVIVAVAIAGCNGGGGGGSPTGTPSPTPTPTPTVALGVQIVGPGSVTSAPPAIACPAACTATFSVGTSVTLTAVATSSGTFQRWFDVPCTTASSCGPLVLQTNAALDVLFHCTPTTSAGCPASEGCRVAAYRGVDTATCSPTGGGGQAATCTTAADCQRDFDCIDTGAGKKCEKNCVVGGAGCGGLTCSGYSTAFVLDGVEYGICN